ncbi:MAG: regulatory protein RecX [Mariprofundaceae bacterium]
MVPDYEPKEENAEEDLKQALRYALRLLARREYCEEEVRSRLLTRDFDKTCIRQVLNRLIELDYLSENRFACAFFRDRMRRGDTPWLAAAKAKGRGVRETEIQSTLAAIVEEYDAVEACRKLLARRDPQLLHLTDQHQWRKHARYLKNKGFDTATIVGVMNEGEG